MRVAKAEKNAGILVSSFKLGIWDRLKVLFTGNVYLVMDTKYKEPMKTVLTVHRKMIYKHKKAA